MDAETREALEASIKHWEENAAATSPDGVNTDANACALCNMFDPHLSVGACKGCPVSEKVGRSNCYHTPYYKARAALRNWKWAGPKSELAAETFKSLATEEVDFLKSLRPTDEQEAA